MERFTENPDAAVVDGIRYGFDHVRAVAFAVVQGSVIYGEGLSHQAIFRCLDFLDPERQHPGTSNQLIAQQAQANPRKFLRTNGVHWVPQLDHTALAYFHQHRNGIHHEFRCTVSAGRAWIGLGETRSLNIFSFWVRQKTVPLPVLHSIVAALKLLNQPIQVEFAGSKASLLMRMGEIGGPIQRSP